MPLEIASNSKANFNLENVNLLDNANVNPKNGVAYKKPCKTYLDIIRHTRNSAYPLHRQPCYIQNPGLFRTGDIFKSLSIM